MDGYSAFDVIITVVIIVVDVSSNTQVVGNRRDVIVVVRVYPCGQPICPVRQLQLSRM